MCTLSSVDFHGDTIFCIDFQNQPFTPMRPIVENMGLAWQSQAAKLNANKERWTVMMIVTVAQDGIEREMLSMPVRKLPAWLNSINPKKVREELRPKIELYQAESDDALWNYWMTGRAERPVIENGSITPSHRSELKAIVDAKLSTYPASVQGKARSEIWTRFNRNFKIAEYAQLPAKRMAEARDYLIELDVKALKKLPAADSYALPKALPPTDKESLTVAPTALPFQSDLPATDDIDGHFAAIREHIRQINNHEEAIFQAARMGMPPLRGTSSLALLIHRNMENAGWSLHYALKSLEASARIAVAAGQI